MIIPSIYVKFSYMNLRADLNGDDDEGEDKDEDEEDSNDNDDGNESILKFIYFVASSL